MNVIPYVQNSELSKYYSEHKVFLQLSLSEGLPNTLCEAMLCECIPVGSDVNGIPEAIGDCGFILDRKDPDLAVELIRKALDSGDELGRMARQRIKELYPKTRRVTALKNVILGEDK